MKKYDPAKNREADHIKNGNCAKSSFDKGMKSVIATLECAAEALQAGSYHEEAGLVSEHLRVLRNPSFKLRYKNIIKKDNLCPQAVIDTMILELADTIV